MMICNTICLRFSISNYIINLLNDETLFDKFTNHTETTTLIFQVKGTDINELYSTYKYNTQTESQFGITVQNLHKILIKNKKKKKTKQMYMCLFR